MSAASQRITGYRAAPASERHRLAQHLLTPSHNLQPTDDAGLLTADLSLPRSDPRTGLSSQGHRVGGSPGAISSSRISSEHQVDPRIKKNKAHVVPHGVMVTHVYRGFGKT